MAAQERCDFGTGAVAVAAAVVVGSEPAAEN